MRTCCITLCTSALAWRTHIELAVSTGDAGAAIRGEAAITNNLQLVSKLLGVLVNVHETRHQHILTHPDYLRLREVLLRALAPFPDARLAVGRALAGIETQAAEDITKTADPRSAGRRGQAGWTTALPRAAAGGSAVSLMARDLAYSCDPVAFAKDCGVHPDPWQQDFLRAAAAPRADPSVPPGWQDRNVRAARRPRGAHRAGRNDRGYQPGPTHQFGIHSPCKEPLPASARCRSWPTTPCSVSSCPTARASSACPAKPTMCAASPACAWS